LRTRTAGPNGGLWTGSGVLGENIKIADIDSGLDYVHTNFGGDGDYAGVTDTNANGKFPNAKVPGGTDFVGDSYNATQGSPTFQPIPHPDPNPFDGDPSGSSAGHGTATASLIAGFGVNSDGSKYAGTYDATNPVMSNLKIPPGFAPKALLFPLRVFGNSGGSDVVPEAIEWAIDPNGDGDFSDRMDVINMSLGSDEGYTDDPTAVAAANAAAIGILVCSAAGNPGDSYYSHSSPAVAAGTLSVSATFNDQSGSIFDSNVTANAPGSIAGQKYFSLYGSPSPKVPAGGLTGDVVYGVPNDGNPNQGAGPYTPLSNAAQIAGKICLMDRGGGIGFATKCGRAQASGAIAVIVNNFNNPGADPIVMALNSSITIPCVMISRTDRDTINAAAGGFNATTGLPNTNTVNVTINSDNAVVVKGTPATDTVPSYSGRGPGLPDSRVKPDLSAPAEVTAVATNRSGNEVRNFNGTSSATPHVAGMMALLRQFHPTWSVQELNALACNTATRDIFTTTAQTTQFGVGRIGAGRIDLTNAANAKVIAFNGSDPDLLGVSFGVVETPVDGVKTLTKNITVKNKGTNRVRYNLTIQNNPAVAGASFSFPNGTSVAVDGGQTATVPVRFTTTGSALRHAREASVSSTQATTLGTLARHWLTEAAGYAVFTPTGGGGSPTLRVSLYAAPKPVSAMHTTATNFVVAPNSSGSVSLPLAGTPVNTGSSFPTDIISLVKPFELQHQGVAPSPDPDLDPANVLRYVGVTSDYSLQQNKANTVITFGLEGFGNAAVPEFNSSDKEIFINSTGSRDFDFAIFLSSGANSTTTSHTNVYFPFLVNLGTGTVTPLLRTNLVSPATRDTNSFNNSAVLVSVPTSALSSGNLTSFRYVVATFDRNGDLVDQTPLLTYSLVNPGFVLSGGNFEPFFYNDLTTTSIPVQFNQRNFTSNGSLGVWLVHMHNGDGDRSDVVTFTTQ
jgi:subtilisin family serine protease